MHVTGLLAQRRFEELETLTRGIRLTADEIQRATDDYPHRILPLSEEDVERRLDLEENVFPIDGTFPPAYHVDVHLMDEEGADDLTLSLRLTEGPGEMYAVSIQNLHIL